MLYFFSCQKQGHVISVELSSEADLKKFKNKCSKLLKVCPLCKPENVQIVECDNPNKWSDVIVLECSCKHQTTVSMFSHGGLHFKWGSDSNQFINIDGELDDLLKTKKMKCLHMHNDKVCGKKLKKIGGDLSLPSAPSIKTRVRVGDIWDKAKVPEARHSSYTSSRVGGTMVADYHETEFDRRFKRRVKDMKSGKIEVFDDKSKKTKIVKRDRINKNPPGQII